MRNTLLIIVAIIVVATGIWWALDGNNPPLVSDFVTNEQNSTTTEGTISDESGNEPQVLGENIRLLTPRSGATVNSPLVVKGEARKWYFEGSFPVKLIGPDGKVLAEGPAQAKGNWMTANWVPFEATLTFNAGVAGDGKLILQNDNPSGLPELQESVTVPVKIGKTDSTTVKIYLSKESSFGSDCTTVFAVNRTIPKTEAVARAAIIELLKGPTVTEKSNGYITSLPATVTLKDITITNGTAYVDFSDGMSGGSCRTANIGSQIRNTLLQFPSIKKVVITAKTSGDPNDVLQP